MRYDITVYGPHGNVGYQLNYYYDETSLQYGFALNDANDSIGFPFQFQKTGTIDSIGMHLVEYVGVPDYALGAVTISGTIYDATEPYPAFDPNTRVGTIYSNSQWQDFEPDVVGSGWSWIDLATPLNVTKGDFAAFIVIPSGAVVPNSTNYVEINDESNIWRGGPGTWRYSTYWSMSNWDSPIGIKYSDTTIQGFCITSPIWEEYVSTEEWGVEFQIPVQATCVGGLFNLYPIGTGPNNAPFKMILADSSDTELASVTILDYDLVGSYNNDNVYLAWDTATDPVLSPDVSYRLYLKPTSSEPINKTGFQLDSENSKAGMPGGTNWKWIERSTPASGWTYEAAYYPYISVALVDLQGGGGNGGNGGDGEGGAAFGFIG